MPYECVPDVNNPRTRQHGAGNRSNTVTGTPYKPGRSGSNANRSTHATLGCASNTGNPSPVP